jgi:hypothetical protein
VDSALQHPGAREIPSFHSDYPLQLFGELECPLRGAMGLAGSRQPVEEAAA